jgi:hypothetical protein
MFIFHHYPFLLPCLSEDTWSVFPDVSILKLLPGEILV